MAGVQSLGLLEREVESAAIRGAVKAAAHHGGLLLLEGPAGIGKTRLLAEVRTVAAETGLEVARARATELERDFAFGSVRQLFEPLLARTDPTGQEAVLWEGPAAQAREIFIATITTAALAGDFAVLHGLYWLTANACQHHPLLLLVDDLQWCDTPSLRYLAYLLPRLEELPVLVVAALRTGERATDQRLLEQIITDPVVQVLRPQPLSAHATSLFLEQALTAAVDEEFAAACHQAAGGNPLLLHELARTLTAEGVAATADNAARVTDLGPRAVDRLVAVRLARLPQECAVLARAVAVLGDRTDLTTAAALAEQDTTTALAATAALERVEILRSRNRDERLTLSFVHPLFQATVHNSIDFAGLAVAHRHAAMLLAKADANPERVAAHLLRVPPCEDPEVVTALRGAAASAIRRGAPASAYSYLRRALEEPPDDGQRLDVLVEAGRAASLGDLETACRHLQQAYDQTADPALRADIALQLGTAYLYLLKPDLACSVWTEAVSQAPGEDARRRLEAILLNSAFMFPGLEDILARLPRLRQLPEHDSIGGRMLDCAIASADMRTGDCAAIPRALRALADGSLVEQAIGDSALTCGWLPLLAADDDAVMDSLQAAVKRSHHVGSLRALCQTYGFRALGWLWRGQLHEAEIDARESISAARMAGAEINQLFAGAYLADTLMEQGRLDEAEQILQSIGITTTTQPPGPAYFALDSHTRLLRLRSNHQAALDAALLAGKTWAAYGFTNPALGSWRSEAALALHALGRTPEALQIAAEELRLSRQWGAPRALGRALRVNGLLTKDNKGMTLLREAVAVLEHSPARLEYARALADLGAALRRGGHRTDARPYLRQALDLATRCGAAPLADQAGTELAAAGGRPRRTELAGPDSLTPSEHRIAEMAAGGATNRQIAQDLYVTPKTVEVHLSAVYRKLGITTRTELPSVLTGPDKASGDTPTDTPNHPQPDSLQHQGSPRRDDSSTVS